MTTIYRTGTYYGETEQMHIWEITDEKGIAAELYVSLDHHEIMNIEVRKDRRGEGLARELFDTADEQIGIFHTLNAHMTDEGLAFAEAVGGGQVDECHIEHCACAELEEFERERDSWQEDYEATEEEFLSSVAKYEASISETDWKELEAAWKE